MKKVSLYEKIVSMLSTIKLLALHFILASITLIFFLTAKKYAGIFTDLLIKKYLKPLKHDIKNNKAIVIIFIIIISALIYGHFQLSPLIKTYFNNIPGFYLTMISIIIPVFFISALVRLLEYMSKQNKKNKRS
ncbi:MAG: hypothetical protein GY730_10735 [bacterium]|nr:hypothetical protein [bacterium]